MAQNAAFTVAFNLEPQFDGSKLDGALSQIQQKVKTSPDLDLDLQIKGVDTSQAQEVVNSLKKQYEQVSNVVLKTKEYKDAMGETKTAITGLTADLSEMIVTSQGIVEVTSKYSTNFNDAGMRVSEMSKKYDKLRLNAEEWHQRAASMSDKEKLAIQSNANTLKSLISQYEKMGNKSPAEIQKLEEKIKAADEALKKTVASTKRSASGLQDWASTMERAIRQTIAYSTSLGLVRAAQRMLNDAIEYSIDLNTEMTKIQVLQAEGAQTPQEITNLAKSYNELAKELGATTIEIAEGSVEWLRQGKSVEETADLMRASTMMAKLGNTELAEATEYLTSTLNGFEMQGEEAIAVVDKLVHIDNIAATSTKELATALRYVSAVAHQSGVTFEQLVSYITVMSETTRLNAEQIGQSLKTIFTRMQDIMQGGLDADGMGINNVERALERVDVQLRDSETSFRDLSSVLEDVAGKWDTLNEVEQANVAKAIAGVRQQNLFRILMSEMSTALEYQAEAYGALGTATERYDIYLESIEAKQAELKASMETLYMDAIEDGLITGLYDAAIAVVDLIDKLGGLKTIVLAVTAAFILFNKTKITDKVLDLTVAFLNLGSTIKGVNLTALSGTGVIGKLSTALGIATGSTFSLTTAMGALWTAIAPFAIPAVIIGGLLAIGNAIDASAEKVEKFADKVLDSRDALNELNRVLGNIKQLQDDYNLLTEKQADGTELTEAETRRLINVQNELKDLLPILAGYTDEYGNFVIESADALDKATKATIDYQNAQKPEIWKTSAKDAEKMGKALGNLANEVKAQELFKEMKSGFALDDEEMSELRDEYKKAFEISADVFGEFGYEGMQAFIDGLKKKLGEDDDLVKLFQENLYSSVDAAVDAVQNDPNISLANIFTDYGDSDEAEDAGDSAAEAYVRGLLEKMGLSESEISAQMKDIFTSAVPSAEFFTEMIPDIEEGISVLTEAFEDIANQEIIGKDQIEELEKFDLTIRTSIDGTQELFHVAEDGSKTAIGSLEEYIDAQLELLVATNKINPVMLEAARNMLYASLKTDELKDSISQSVGKVDALSSALSEQAQNGYMSVQTGLKLISTNNSLRGSLQKVANGFYLNEDAARRAAFAELKVASAMAQIPGLASAAASGNWLLAQSLIDTAVASAEAKEELADLLGVYASFATTDFSFSGGGGGGGGGGGPSPEEEALQDQIDAIQDVIDRENRLWQERTRIWDRAIEDFERQIDAINKKYDSLIKPFQDQVDALQDAIDDSAEALDDLKWSYQDRLWELEDQIDAWEDEIDEWEDALERETQLWRDEIDGWEDYIDDLEDEIDALNDAREEELEPLEDQLKALEEYRDTELEVLKEQKDIYKDQVSDLKDLLKEYNEYINTQKESLKLMKEEEDYLDSLKDKNEELGKIKSEIAILSLDDSEKAIAERLKLEEKAAGIEEEIAEEQADREYELKIKALEDAREAFEDNINAQIDAIEDLMDAIDDEIELINEQIEALEKQIDVINRRYDKQIEAIEDEIEHYDDLIEANEDLIETEEERYEKLIEGNEKLIEGYEEEIDAINAIIEEAERQHEILSHNNEEQIEAIEDRIEALERERDTHVSAIERKIAAIEEERFHAQRAHEDRMWQLEEEKRRLEDLMKQYEDIGGGGGGGAPGAWNNSKNALEEYEKELERASKLLRILGIDTSTLSDEAILEIYDMTKEWHANGVEIDEAAKKAQEMALDMGGALLDVDDSLGITQEEVNTLRGYIEDLGVDTSDMSDKAVEYIGDMIQKWKDDGVAIHGVRSRLNELAEEAKRKFPLKLDTTGNALRNIEYMRNKLKELGDTTVTVNVSGGSIGSETGTKHSMYHQGGIVEEHHSGNSFAGRLRSNEVFAKLLKGEYVSTEGQMDNFLKTILPKIITNSSPSIDRSRTEKEVNIELNIPINVEGNMDENVLPDIDDIADKAIGKINDILIQRGIRRNVSKFGF